MDKRIVYAIIAGVLLYVVLIYLASVQRDLTIHQLILIFVTPLVMGIISSGAKKGLVLGFVISLIMLTVEVIVLQPGSFADINMFLAVIIMSLPFVLISAALGAVGGLIGRRMFKKRN